jgi:hypothetical protein
MDCDGRDCAGRGAAWAPAEPRAPRSCRRGGHGAPGCRTYRAESQPGARPPLRPRRSAWAVQAGVAEGPARPGAATRRPVVAAGATSAGGGGAQPGPRRAGGGGGWGAAPGAGTEPSAPGPPLTAAVLLSARGAPLQPLRALLSARRPRARTPSWRGAPRAAPPPRARARRGGGQCASHRHDPTVHTRDIRPHITPRELRSRRGPRDGRPCVALSATEPNRAPIGGAPCSRRSGTARPGGRRRRGSSGGGAAGRSTWCARALRRAAPHRAAPPAAPGHGRGSPRPSRRPRKRKGSAGAGIQQRPQQQARRTPRAVPRVAPPPQPPPPPRLRAAGSVRHCAAAGAAASRTSRSAPARGAAAGAAGRILAGLGRSAGLGGVHGRGGPGADGGAGAASDLNGHRPVIRAILAWNRLRRAGLRRRPAADPRPPPPAPRRRSSACS